MADMSDLDKLRMLLPHWIDHNKEHAADFERWAKVAGPATPHIEEAARHLSAANDALEVALAELGRPLEHRHGHEHKHSQGH